LLAKPYHYEASGLDNVYLRSGKTAYGQMIHIANVPGLHRAIGLHIVEKAEPLTGPEFRFLRKQIGLSQAALAKRMQVTDQTIANYEKGHVGIGTADPFMRAMYLLHVLPEGTRLEVVKKMVERQRTAKPRKSIPNIQQIVGKWRDADVHAAA
jgi:DNA-binding transcriptional regulator YiaG